MTNVPKRRLTDLSPGAKLALMVAVDTAFLPLCVFAAVSLRLGSVTQAWGTALSLQVALGLLTVPGLALAGLYRALVRYIDLSAMVASGTALAGVVLGVFLAATSLDVQFIPRSALLIYWFVGFAYVVSSRLIARTLLRQELRRVGARRKRTAIYGAGEAGVQLARAMDYSREYQAVCFIDDSVSLQAKTVQGLRVYAPDEIAVAVERHDVMQIVLAIPSASSSLKRTLIGRVEHCGLPIKILPPLMNLVDGRASISDIREVDVADLLGRDPVPPQPSLFAHSISGRAVLVTGAGGSIGAELCRQILTQRPRTLVLLDHSEYALYAIDQELRQSGSDAQIIHCLGSVLDEDLLNGVLRAHGVQTIYHAAAYKHVPIVESNIRQGLRNNVFGTLAVARAATAQAVETCVLVSTDKAVRPTNVMGASKRVAELIFQAASHRTSTQTVFSMVRFGNVLGSSGSVVPLFKRQIANGGPITITHPDIIRYFMLIPEAAQLVIQAGAMAKGGEVFVLDMGQPVKIADLARSMIHLSGLTERTPENPEGDITIEYVGLRPGEKLYEELLIGDNSVPSGHPRILCARERHIEPVLLDKMLESLRGACDANDSETILRQLRNLVPEYEPGPYAGVSARRERR